MVTSRTGGAFHITEDDLTAHIFLSTMVAVDTEVMSVVESAFMVPVTETVGPDLFGDGSGIFTEIFGDFFKGEFLI